MTIRTNILNTAKRFLLRFDPARTRAPNQTFADGQLLDIAAEGMFDGASVHKMTNVGTPNPASIVSGQLVFLDSSITGTNGTCVVKDRTSPAVPGRVLYAKVTAPPAGKFGPYIGYSANKIFPLDRKARFVIASDLTLNINNGGANIPVGSVTASTPYEFIIATTADGHAYFVKGGAQHPTWAKVYCEGKGVGAWHAVVLNQQFSGPVDKLVIPERLYVDQITPFFHDDYSGPAGSFDATRVPIEGSYFTADAARINGAGSWEPNGLTSTINILQDEPSFIQFDFTKIGASAAGGMYYYLRWAQGTVWVRVYIRHDGYIHLSKFDGAEIILDSSNFTLNAGTSYRLKIADDGLNMNVFIDDVPILNGVDSYSNSGKARELAQLIYVDASNYFTCQDWQIHNRSGYSFSGID